MIKNKLLLIALATSIVLTAAVQAQTFEIQIGDRPFFSHGQHYWAGDYEMIWVPGYRSSYGHHWIHGHYVRREHRRHDWNRGYDDRHDNQRDIQRDDNRR